MASEIRVNKINNRAGLGTVTYTDTGIIVSGIVTANGGIKIPNNTGKLELGSSQQFDLSINGSGEALINTTGVLNLATTSFRLRRANGSAYLMNADQGGGLYLYHNGGSPKLSTISKGIKVGTGVTIETNGQATFVGVVTATSFSGDGSSLSNLPAGAPVGGASTNTVFFENDNTIGVGYSVTSGKNAMSAGPLTINVGIAVTVPTGSSWTIV